MQNFTYKRFPLTKAIQFTGSKENLAEILALSNTIGVISSSLLQIQTGFGLRDCHQGDWIIEGGEFYPVAQSIFNEMYEAVPEGQEKEVFPEGSQEKVEGITPLPTWEELRALDKELRRYAEENGLDRDKVLRSWWHMQEFEDYAERTPEEIGDLLGDGEEEDSH